MLAIGDTRLSHLDDRKFAPSPRARLERPPPSIVVRDSACVSRVVSYELDVATRRATTNGGRRRMEGAKLNIRLNGWPDTCFGPLSAATAVASVRLDAII
jgi:hypothetical protein